MPSKFTGKRAVLMIPVSWLNEVANMLTKFHSPNDVIRVTVEGAGEASYLSFDINATALASAITNDLSGQFVKKGDSWLLGDGLKWNQRGLSIDVDWLQRQIIQLEKA